MTDRIIVVVGGVAGGASAAARARRLDERARIILFERDQHVSLATCGMPYYVGGEIEDRSRLLVVKPELLESRHRIEVRTGHEVTRVDGERHVVHARRLSDGVEIEQPYDRLILSPGAIPIRPDIPGVHARNVFTLRNMVDTDALRAHLEEWHPRHAVVVGAGFIGLEMVEQLSLRGVSVTLVELLPQVLPALDAEMADVVRRALELHGIDLRTGTAVTAIVEDNGHATHVELDSGERIETQLVLLGIGVRPNVALARDAGLELGPSGGIRIDDGLRTSDPDIFAVGDAVELRHHVSGQPFRANLAGPASRAGRLAAQHAVTGEGPPMATVNGTAIVRVFETVAAMTGLTLRGARALGLEAEAVIVEAASHAGYYPGARSLLLKLVYEKPTGRVLGAQCVGADGVDKRIDVISTALRFGATVESLTELDLCYAPPFGSVRDPVHQAAFAASNARAGLVDVLQPDADLSGRQVLDVRTPAEVAEGMLDGAVHIPLDDLRERLGELDPAKDTAVLCRSGLRGYLACRILSQHGFRAANVTGGMIMRGHAERALLVPIRS